MQTSIYVGISSQLAIRKKVDAIADNIANANTIGFRAESLNFNEVLSRLGRTTTSFSSAGAPHLSRNSGAIIRTDNVLDFAISGEGWFAIADPEGRAYTRDGRFVVAPGGELKTLSGRNVLDAGGAPITVEPDGSSLVVARDGMITQNGVQNAAIGLFTVDKDAKMMRLEGSAIRTNSGGTPIVNFVNDGIIQGSLESSNVSSIHELTNLITAQRHFEAINGALESQEGLQLEAIRLLGPSYR